jgi:hypothetical protein
VKKGRVEREKMAEEGVEGRRETVETSGDWTRGRGLGGGGSTRGKGWRAVDLYETAFAVFGRWRVLQLKLKETLHWFLLFFVLAAEGRRNFIAPQASSTAFGIHCSDSNAKIWSE